MDINAIGIETMDKGYVGGNGNGVSIFIGLEEENFLYIAQDGIQDNEVLGRTKVRFGVGEVLIVPYGVLHAGVENCHSTSITSITYKGFFDVAESNLQESTSQIWLREKGAVTTDDPRPAGFYVSKSYGTHLLPPILTTTVHQ
jgi:hypothetical protein